MREFLAEILPTYSNQTILLIGHRATQYALENIINHIPLDKTISAPWSWQPGWEYKLKLD
jgi:alpha-ribazole phosphatase/probable phosphoglycerate mutase